MRAIAALPAAAAAGLLLVPLAALLGERGGLVDRPGDGALKIHRRPVPLTGGVGVAAALLVALAALRASPPPEVLAALGLALLLGTLDDARPLPAWPRLAVLVAAGTVLGAGAPGTAPVVVAAAVLLVPACANAVNLLDGQDGLAGGVAAAAALGLAGVLAPVDAPAAALATALAGALLAFLAWNRPPARVFLGNGGAYAVGALLGALSVSAVAGLGARGLLAAALCLALPAFELAFTVARRLRWRRGLTSGDRLHSYDLASAARGGRFPVTLRFWGIGGGAAAAAVVASRAPLWVAVVLVALAVTLAAAAAARLWPHVHRRADVDASSRTLAE